MSGIKGLQDGIQIETITNTKPALQRLESIKKLCDYIGNNGLKSSDAIKFIILPNGNVKCLAKIFIPARTHLIHLPAALDMKPSSLMKEIITSSSIRIETKELNDSADKFERDFNWTNDEGVQKDFFSRNVEFIMCILCMMKIVKDRTDDTITNTTTTTGSIGSTGASSSTTNSSANSNNSNSSSNGTYSNSSGVTGLMKVFKLYWKTIPEKMNTVLYDWADEELIHLKASSLRACIPDMKRFGKEIYQQVVKPFTDKYSSIFGNNLTFKQFIQISGVIWSRSFGESGLLPVIDLINGITNSRHNCELEGIIIPSSRGEYHPTHVVESTTDINAGDEILLEYAQCGNGDYLLAYNHIPMDRGVVLDNEKTDITLFMAKFFNAQLMLLHRNSPGLRKKKMKFMYENLELPDTMVLSAEEIKAEPTIVRSIRQMLLFLLLDETQTRQTLATTRIKGQYNVDDLVELFLVMIESNLGVPNVRELDNKLKQIAAAPVLVSTAKHNQDSTKVNGDNSKRDGDNKSTDNDLETKGTDGEDVVEYDDMVDHYDREQSAIFLLFSEWLATETLIELFIETLPPNQHFAAWDKMRSHLVSDKLAKIYNRHEKAMKERNMTLIPNCCMWCGSTGRLSTCSRCKQAFYCSGDCQKRHWKYHKRRGCEKKDPECSDSDDDY